MLVCNYPNSFIAYCTNFIKENKLLYKIFKVLLLLFFLILVLKDDSNNNFFFPFCLNLIFIIEKLIYQ